MYMESYVHFSSGKEIGTREFGVEFVVERSMKRKVLDFKAVDKRICISRIITKFHNLNFITVYTGKNKRTEQKRKFFYQKM
jgi:hypothetical protein